MTAQDVMPSVDMALWVSGLSKKNASKLLSDNGSCYIAGELKNFLTSRDIKPIQRKPMYPQTQGEIERYHRTMKNVVKLDNYYSPKDLEEAIDQVIDYYNNCRVHEALGNITPADVYFGRAEQILQERQQIKLQTIRERRKNYIKDKYKMIEKQI